MLPRIKHFLMQELWRTDPAKVGRWQGYALWSLRLVVVMAHELLGGQLTLRAMSLVYTSLLSLVPLLALSFSVLKAFGVHNQIEPLLLNLLAPLGPKGEEIVVNVLNFVENMKVGVLGFVGLALLIYTVISLIQKIESAFNYVWRVNRPRSLARRFSDYLSVIMVGPVLVFSAIGVTASVMNTRVVQWIVAIEPFGSAVVLLGKLMPFLFIIAAFTFIYVFVPNTKVRIRSALVGALIGGILWQATGMVFASFAAGSTRYAAIYSGFAILILFMIWLYLSWFILLFGAQISFFHQYPLQMRLERQESRLSNRFREQLGLELLFLIARAHHRGEAAWSQDSFNRYLDVPDDAIAEVLDDLVREGILVETADDPPAYLLARDSDQLSLAALLSALRRAGERDPLLSAKALREAPVARLVHELEQGAAATLDGVTLKDLVREGEGQGGQPEVTA